MPLTKYGAHFRYREELLALFTRAQQDMSSRGAV